MPDTHDLQTPITLGPVPCGGQTLSRERGLQMAVPLPHPDEPLPDPIEAFVPQAGRDIERRLFPARLEPADHALVLQRRQGQGGGGIRRRGTRPVTFQATVGVVTVQRSRIEPQKEGTMAGPAARVGHTSHPLHIPQNRRDAVGDPMSDPSPGKSGADVGQDAGDEPRWGRSTILDRVPQEGEPRIVAPPARVRALLDGACAAPLAWLGPAAADPDARTGWVDDDPPFDDAEEAPAAGEQTQAAGIATGVPGWEPALPVAQDAAHAGDAGFVIVAPAAVTTTAQPSTGRTAVGTSTAVVRVGGWRSAFADLGVEGLGLQVAALLVELGVLSSARRLLVRGDGAAWIRTGLERLGISLQAMIVCWWPLRQRCDEPLSWARGPQERRRAFDKELLGPWWQGQVETAHALRRGTREWVRNPAAVAELSASLEQRRAALPNSQQRHPAG